MPPNPSLNAYRIPSVLRDLVLVDMLEITGSTVAAAQLLNLSQSSVSRRYRQLAAELGVQPNRRHQPGLRFADADWIGLLRQGVNRHRLDCGVLRLGGPAAVEPWVRRRCSAEWIPLRNVSLAHADELLQHALLDGVLLAGEQEALPSHHTLIQLPVADGSPLWLRCRPDPLVLALAQRWVPLPIA